MNALPSCLIDKIGKSDGVFHAGDADTSDFIAELRKNSKELYAVRGNCDYKSVLPEKLTIEKDGVKICLCHGSGRHDNVIERLYYTFADDNPDIIIFGHTHAPLINKIDGITFINPGSPLRNRSVPYGTFASLETEGGKFRAKILRTDEI